MDSFLFEEKFKEKHFYATILNSIYEHKQKDSFISLVMLQKHEYWLKLSNV